MNPVSVIGAMQAPTEVNGTACWPQDIAEFWEQLFPLSTAGDLVGNPPDRMDVERGLEEHCPVIILVSLPFHRQQSMVVRCPQSFSMSQVLYWVRDNLRLLRLVEEDRTDQWELHESRNRAVPLDAPCTTYHNTTLLLVQHTPDSTTMVPSAPPAIPSGRGGTVYQQGGKQRGNRNRKYFEEIIITRLEWLYEAMMAYETRNGTAIGEVENAVAHFEDTPRTRNWMSLRLAVITGRYKLVKSYNSHLLRRDETLREPRSIKDRLCTFGARQLSRKKTSPILDLRQFFAVRDELSFAIEMYIGWDGVFTRDVPLCDDNGDDADVRHCSAPVTVLTLFHFKVDTHIGRAIWERPEAVSSRAIAFGREQLLSVRHCMAAYDGDDARPYAILCGVSRKRSHVRVFLSEIFGGYEWSPYIVLQFLGNDEFRICSDSPPDTLSHIAQKRAFGCTHTAEPLDSNEGISIDTERTRPTDTEIWRKVKVELNHAAHNLRKQLHSLLSTPFHLDHILRLMMMDDVSEPPTVVVPAE